MTLTIENQPLTICQVTQHGLLIPWGRFARYLKLSQRLRAAVPPRHHKDALSGGGLVPNALVPNLGATVAGFV
jgi:hypothetical protein